MSQFIEQSLVELTKYQAMLMLETGYFLLETKRADEAKAVFEGAAALMPRSEVPQLGLGQVYLGCGKYDEALKAFKVAARLNPKSGAAHAYAAEALLLAGKEAEAQRELQSAIKLDPDGDGAKLAQAIQAGVAEGMYRAVFEAQRQTT